MTEWLKETALVTCVMSDTLIIILLVAALGLMSSPKMNEGCR